ncbi:hypothetical protein D3C73_1526310 [compost metagenome]
MAMHDIHASPLHQPVREGALRRIDVVAPVATPVDRYHHEVAGTLVLADLRGDAIACGGGPVIQQVHAGMAGRGAPCRWGAAVLHGEGKYRDAPAAWPRQPCRPR